MAKKKKSRLPPFVPVIRSTMASPAWKAMSYGARCLYIVLTSYVSFDGKNNGRVYRPYREVCGDLGGHSKTSVGFWFRELEHYGFIVMTEGHKLGVDGYGKAAHWRLTEFATQDAKGFHIAPTRDFDRWDGVLYVRPKPPPKTETRTTKEDSLSSKMGHSEPVLDSPNCPTKEDICFEPEVSSKVGHILVATPLPSLKTPGEDLLEYVASVIKQQLDEHEARRAGEARILPFPERARVA